MVCEGKEQLLHAYFDGELDLVRSLEVEEHVKTCASCAQELLSQQTLRKAMRSANLQQRASGALRARIEAMAAGSAGASSGTSSGDPAKVVRMQAAGRRRMLEWIAGAAAILVAAALGIRAIPGILNARQSDLVAQEIVASHIRSLQPGHLFDIESTDQHTVKPWFDGKIDFAPPVRDLTEQGYPLLGGRLDYVGGRDVAVLVYQLRKHYINVFIWPDTGEQMKLPASSSAQGYNMMCWSRGGMRLCSVSDVNADDLQKFVRAMQR